LTLARWYWQAPYLPQCGSIAATAHAKRLADLPERDRYAAMELWRGTIAAHSLIARRSDAGRDCEGPVFNDVCWRGYVPLRLPHTICVEERLPAGAAGALLNRSHPFHDLVLIIDGQERRMFDAIDGRRSIAEIAEQAGAGRSPGASVFFEKLWRYDQVVFNTSNTG
jgi:hypothetical protein